MNFSIAIIGALACVVVLTLLFIRQRKLYATINSISIKDYKPHTDFYNCPECNNKMDSGFRIANQGIFWTTELKGIYLKQLTSTPLTNTAAVYARNNGNKAWKCDKCKLILIDHNRLLTN